MGNHKGRSKGCRTCVKRRVKCDQVRPICLRCSNGSFRCLGYRDAFVDNQDQILRKVGKKGSSKHLRDEDQKVVMVFESSQVLDPSSKYPASQFHSPVSVLAWKDDIMLSYLLNNTREGPLTIICRRMASPGYHSNLQQQNATSKCFLALATVFFGIGHSEQSLVLEGRRVYGQALNKIAMMIHNPDDLEFTEALTSLYILSLFEAISPTSNGQQSWTRHMFGLEQLFKISGPPVGMSDPLYVTLFEATRLTIIVAALHDHRPSLLANPEWSAVSIYLQLHPDIDPALLELAFLVDALAQLTKLCFERDNILPLTRDTLQGVVSLKLPVVCSILDRSLNLLSEIQSRRILWTQSHPLSEFLSTPRLATSSSQPYPFTEAIYFSSLNAANTFNLYNTAIILIHQFASSIYQLLPVNRHNLVTDDVLAPEHTSSAAVQIMKSIEYYLLSANPVCSSTVPRTSASATSYLLLSVRVAYSVLAQSVSPEDKSRKEWLVDVFSVVERQRGPWTSNKQLFSLGTS